MNQIRMWRLKIRMIRMMEIMMLMVVMMVVEDDGNDNDDDDDVVMIEMMMMRMMMRMIDGSDDLDEDDREAFWSASARFLPSKDQSGRSVLFFCPKRVKFKDCLNHVSARDRCVDIF